ncbi:hypothetical protein [Rathayibacter sp. AY1A7]|uniref:hypothetical protein n=1 Tax=Rathayibacter sp. AY1A7 TaxID=2080524 RepID=UPI000CE80BFA|nr:hypothetical protein [Rathayibacter sp. AY1A7]PPF20840.1 hypothetical protein C5B95_07180 [Rathayibacter sp. AY1A7]
MDAELRSTQQWLQDHASAVGGIRDELELYFAPDEPLDAFASRRQRLQVDLLLGAVWNASIIVIDECFADLASLEGGAWGEEPWIRGALPERFLARYDIRFLRRFLLTTAAVTAALATEWRAPNSVAEELAVRLILDKVEVAEDLYELDLPHEWRDGLEGILLEDLDHERLYENSWSGAPYDDAGEMSLAFEDWFRPFRVGGPRTPYLEDGLPGTLGDDASPE